MTGENPANPTISRLGNKLAWTESLSDSNIWAYDGPGFAGRDAPGKFGPPSRLIAYPREDHSPEFSPDGTKIVFASGRAGGEDLWLCNRDRGHAVRLTTQGGPTGTPHWSPDGKWIAFDSHTRGDADIYVISPDGGPWRRLTYETSSETQPTWSHDGRWIYFKSNRTGRGEMWKVPAEGGQAIQLTYTGAFEGFESPDGKLFYFSNSNNLGNFAGNGASFDCPNPNVRQEFQVGCDVPPDATHASDTPCSPPPGHQSETHHIHGSPVYWRSDRRGPVIYVWTENDILRAFPFDQQQSRFVTADKKPITVKGCQDTRENPMEPWTLGQAKSPGYFAPDKPNQFAQLHQGMTGGMLSISSNRGIVWATTPTNNDANQKVVPGILRAYDADDLRGELWSSYQVRDRDDFGNFAKHAPPTVANGKVYMPTFSKHISVYGLKPPAPASAVNLLKNGGFEEGKQGWTGDFQVNDGCPYYDTNQGTLCPTKQKKVTLAQVVIAPETGTYRLTAYCGTNIQDGNVVMPSQYKKVTLGVSVNGSLIPTPPAKVATYTGYQKYTFVFKASSQSSIKVWFYAPKVQPIPQTDCGVDEDFQPGSYAIIDVVSLVKITPR